MKAEKMDSSDMAVPLLVRYAAAMPLGSSLGTETFTKSAGENSDEDADTEMRGESSEQSWLLARGATYDHGQGIWFRDGRPFVWEATSQLGTKTHTNVRLEAVDEDRG